jgi:uncharacterized protein (TIRG00374 family)
VGDDQWALDLTVLVLAVRAVGASTPLAAIAIAYAAVNLLNSIPLTPGGVGLVEGGIAASLAASGLDLGSASAAALAYRLVAYWGPLAASIPVAAVQVAAARPAAGPARSWRHGDGGVGLPGGRRPGG